MGASLANLNDGFGAIRKPGDLPDQQLIRELPSQLCSKQLRNFAPAASVLTFNGDDFESKPFDSQS